MKNVLVTGGTGFVGEKIVAMLNARMDIGNVYVTTRNANINGKKNGKVTYCLWDPLSENTPDIPLSEIHSVINLMGENIASGRWSEERKKRIYNSRIIGTKNLISFLNKEATSLESFISTSAIGIYEPNTNELIDENTPVDQDSWLASVCIDWEKTLDELQIGRKVILRVGVVLDGNGGAIEKMKLPFLMGVGGILGDGKQFMSWIHRDDLSELYITSIFDENFSGVYNAVAPEPVTNTSFTKILGSVINRPTIFPVPSFVLKTLFGDMSSVLLDGHRVIPQRLKEMNYRFHYPHLTLALEEIF